ncbi:hypothetical protein SAMN05443575_0819 [Jatrophihabitans endophyticus]|uniref:Integral membrane protein n=1 Tax=Jatrophihabitans endophyticus TaxID=1206085 RepID=A0A1M5E8J1_9ACTN|nr:hypothetical protein [Jatrophihabitans endophyticus]SHF75516.1 hypothetical protein SAMN05443575_0819 [Jatrophihabitans endophyticus]
MSEADGGPDDVAGTPDPVPSPIRVACAILGLEALGLVAAGTFLVYGTIFGHPGGVLRSLLGALMAYGGAAALLLGARSLQLLRPAARTPMVVIQLLALPVAYSLAFQASRVLWGGPILVAALAVLYLLFTPPAREALDRVPPD